jgi:hypothetical protein
MRPLTYYARNVCGNRINTGGFKCPLRIKHISIRQCNRAVDRFEAAREILSLVQPWMILRVTL